MDIVHTTYLMLLILELMLTISIVFISIKIIRNNSKMEDNFEDEVDYEDYLKWKKENGLK